MAWLLLVSGLMLATVVDPQDAPITKVALLGREFDFPAMCCCCGQPADRNVRISATRTTFIVVGHLRRTLTVSVPCCAVCAPRVAWAEHAGFIGLIPQGIGCLLGSLLLGAVVGLPALLAVALLLDALGASSGVRGVVAAGAQWLPAATAAAFFMGWVLRRLRRRPTGELGAGHVCMLGAVYVTRFDSKQTTLAFASEGFALEFARLNRSQLVRIEATTRGGRARL